MTELSAHTPREGSDDFHCLREHLLAVAAQARNNANKFGFGDVGHALGLTHDLAKADPRFQAYLRNCHRGEPSTKCPHSAPGAVAVRGSLGPFALAILGHHGGLPDHADCRMRLESADETSVSWASNFLKEFDALPELKTQSPSWAQENLAGEMLIRMAFSCLVDADFLDTEAHFAPDRIDYRSSYPELVTYLKRLNDKLASFEGETGRVNEARAEILAGCRNAATKPRGTFRLTVPTGGGKTLSSLAFALGHIDAHKMDRVIVAIPYTSIIDQTAAVYKSALDEGFILEHHSSLNVDDSTEGQSELELRRRLSAENWDCPLIVTTTVQLFESLLHNKPSRCRKLHNIVNSVIILDEVQALPPKTLGPIFDVLNELVDHYGCSVVFSTATQLDYSKVEERLLKNAVEIVPEHQKHFENLKRVRYELPDGERTEAQVVDEILKHAQVLVVFNTKKDSLAIARRVPKDRNIIYLSTLLCGHHRKEVIKRVKRHLKEGEPVILISTQVVEAGVDLDFPVVMRDLGPLDRIIQVAGRCNREGKLPGPGRCILFRLEGGSKPSGAYRTAFNITESILQKYGTDLDSSEAMEEFSRDFFRFTETGSLHSDGDRADIQKLRQELAFATVAESFKLIEENATPIVVQTYPTADVDSHIADWKFRPHGWFRRVAQYTVSVYERDLTRLLRDGLARLHESGAYIYSGPYDRTFGIGSDLSDPADLVH